MGNVLTVIQQKFFSKLKKMFSTGRRHSITMIGLDGAGKTTLLYFMKTGDIQHTYVVYRICIQFQVSHNCETLEIEDLTFQVWDIGGQEVFIKFWHNYIKTSSAIVYLVDIADQQRFGKSSDALWTILKEIPTHKPLLILANKVDCIKDEMDKDNKLNSLIEEMSLDKYNGPKKIVPCSVKDACSGASDNANTSRKVILSAFKWLSDELKKLPTEN